MYFIDSFQARFPFLLPHENIAKPLIFLMFLGGLERELFILSERYRGSDHRHTENITEILFVYLWCFQLSRLYSLSTSFLVFFWSWFSTQLAFNLLTVGLVRYFLACTNLENNV